MSKCPYEDGTSDAVAWHVGCYQAVIGHPPTAACMETTSYMEGYKRGCVIGLLAAKPMEAER